MDKKKFITKLGKKELNIGNIKDPDEVVLFKEYFNEQGNNFINKYYNKLLALVLDQKTSFAKAINIITNVHRDT